MQLLHLIVLAVQTVMSITPGLALGTTAANQKSINPNSENPELFKANSLCADQNVSAHHTAITCNGGVAGGTGILYQTVLIKGQCWMARNLEEVPSRYRSTPAWVNNEDVGWWGYYGGRNYPKEGYLYQWSAAMNGDSTERAQGACPGGWHIPTDCEWMYLEHEMGMQVSEQTANHIARKSGLAEEKLRDTCMGGFAALLSGEREHHDGSFSNRSLYGLYWTSTRNGVHVYRREFSSSGSGIYRDSTGYAYAHAIRCLKD